MALVVGGTEFDQDGLSPLEWSSGRGGIVGADADLGDGGQCLRLVVRLGYGGELPLGQLKAGESLVVAVDLPKRLPDVVVHHRHSAGHADLFMNRARPLEVLDGLLISFAPKHHHAKLIEHTAFAKAMPGCTFQSKGLVELGEGLGEPSKTPVGAPELHVLPGLRAWIGAFLRTSQPDEM